MYRTTDANTSTSDWIRLNFDSIPHEAIVRIFGGENADALERVVPECPKCHGGTTCEVCESSGIDPSDDSADCAACEGGGMCLACDGSGTASGDDERELYAWPAAHGTLWQCEDQPEIIEAALASGFVVYRPTDVFGGLILGIDGGGYSFYGAHWIPLRARLAQAGVVWRTALHPADPPELGKDLIKLLINEADREGERGTVERILGEAK